MPASLSGDPAILCYASHMSYEFIESNIEACIKPDYTQLVIVAPIWQGKILLIHRQSEPFKGMYSIPGGHKEDESYETAGRRELEEETGIMAEKLIPMTIFIDHTHKLECHGFKFESTDGSFSNPPGEEQAVLGWKALNQALDLPLTPGLSEWLQKF